jgi:hypothetical protein
VAAGGGAGGPHSSHFRPGYDSLTRPGAGCGGGPRGRRCSTPPSHCV